ncbi:MAG: putative peptidoglycan glycosyltransferase FtsW [bacterium]|nr:putative peptidoglycan glycosyltransferase FtsW [bacterium]
MPRGVKAAGRPDYLIIAGLAFLVLFGLVMLSSASSYLGKVKFDDSYYYLKHQLLFGFLIGLIGFVIASRIYYRYYEKIAIFLLLFSILLLVLVFTPLGVSASGAERWLNIGPISFQPAELLKITFVIYLAAWLSNNLRRSKAFWSGFVPFLIVCGVVSGLLIKQPSTSSVAILMSVALILYFVSGAKLSHILSTILVGAMILGVIIYITPYRLNRITTFLNPEADLLAGGYQLNQARIAIGSGGLWGVGYGQSTTKIHYLPEPIGDSIFAVMAEEFGFVGAGVFIGALIFFIVRILLLTKTVSDMFGKLILIGFASVLAIQAFVNMAAMTGLIPLTGTPLPFVSYGGTALAIFMTMGGIMVNISKYARG